MRKKFMAKDPETGEVFQFNPYSVIKNIKQTIKSQSDQQMAISSLEIIKFDEFEAYMKENKIFFHKQCLWSFFGFFKNEEGICPEK